MREAIVELREVQARAEAIGCTIEPIDSSHLSIETKDTCAFINFNTVTLEYWGRGSWEADLESQLFGREVAVSGCAKVCNNRKFKVYATKIIGDSVYSNDGFLHQLYLIINGQSICIDNEFFAFDDDEAQLYCELYLSELY